MLTVVIYGPSGTVVEVPVIPHTFGCRLLSEVTGAQGVWYCAVLTLADMQGKMEKEQDFGWAVWHVVVVKVA